MTNAPHRFPAVILSLAGALALHVASAGECRADHADRVDVYPPGLSLSAQTDEQRLLVVATGPEGVTCDITPEAAVEIADPAIAQFAEGRVTPLADGETTVRVTWSGHALSIPLSVSHAGQRRPISFRLDVIPILTRAGCNMGTCHGAARGQDGFRLSLFGFDPAGDYHRITRELATRRINLAIPEASLLLEKAIGAVPHTGGKRFDAGSQYYRSLREWLASGAPDDAAEVARVEGIELFPPEVLIQGMREQQPMIVRAHYSDGTDRDVTDLAVFRTNDESVAAVSASGVITAQQRGEAFITARFGTYTVGSHVLVLPRDLVYTPPGKISGNYIDQLVGAKLRKLRIPPSEICTDEEFLRRVMIDVVGLLPTTEEYRQFMADDDPDKRGRLVDALLERPEFADIWAAKWADILMIRPVANVMSDKAVQLYFDWLREQIASHTPLDEIVRQLLTASGTTFDNPAANFYAVERDNLKTAENVAQVFLGIRTQCAQCHNHPFDRWTMDDYYGFAAFFRQISRKRDEDYRQWAIVRGGGEVKHPVSGQNVAPKFLGGSAPDTKGKDRRDVVADWITSPDNPYFARNLANRVWAHFFGQGIVEPVDDVRVSNPPSNLDLFERLAEELVGDDYNVRALARDILTSQTYQRTAQPLPANAHDQRNFSHASYRRIPAVHLLDCICQVTESAEKFRRLPLERRAVETPDHAPGNYFLQTFGRSDRSSACACGANDEPTLSQSLHLLNGTTVHNKVRSGGVISRLLEQKRTPPEMITELYARCLTRQPTEEELQSLTSLVSEADSPQEGLEDVFWALLNSREFVFNH